MYAHFLPADTPFFSLFSIAQYKQTPELRLVNYLLICYYKKTKIYLPETIQKKKKDCETNFHLGFLV